MLRYVFCPKRRGRGRGAKVGRRSVPEGKGRQSTLLTPFSHFLLHLSPPFSLFLSFSRGTTALLQYSVLCVCEERRRRPLPKRKREGGRCSLSNGCRGGNLSEFWGKEEEEEGQAGRKRGKIGPGPPAELACVKRGGGRNLDRAANL